MAGIVRQIVREDRQHARSGLDQDDARRARIDAAEIHGQRLARDLGDGARHLDAGRAAADDDEGQEAALLGLIGRKLGLLEREQNAAPDARRVFDALEAGRELRPLVVAEIGVRRAGRDDQIVIRQVDRLRAQELGGLIDAGHVGHQHGRIGLAAQDVADRPGDVGRRERRGRDLIEQRLEAMVVLPVDDDHVDRRAPQRLGGFQAAEAGPDDDDRRLFWSCTGGSPPPQRFRLRNVPGDMGPRTGADGTGLPSGLPFYARPFSNPRDI